MPNQFTLECDSKVWENEVTLIWHHFIVKFGGPYPRKHSTQFEKSNFKEGSIVEPIIKDHQKGVLDPSFQDRDDNANLL